MGIVKLKKSKPRGLAAWLPKESAPHIYAFSNLIRNGYSEKEAYETVKKQLISSGVATKEDFIDMDKLYAKPK